MKIECSNCQKCYNIPADRLPDAKIASFNCKNCGTKFVLDLRKLAATEAQSNDLKPTESNVLSEKKQVNDLSADNLKEKILKKIDTLPPMPHVVAKTQALLVDSTADSKKNCRCHRNRPGNRHHGT